MGFDVTLHPVNRKEFNYFVEEVFEKPYLMDTKAAVIHNNEQERSYLIQSVYGKFSEFKEQIENEKASVEETICFAGTAILGYLHPYWYLRNGLLSNLLNQPDFKELTSNLSSLVSKEHKKFFDSENGVGGNYSSGVFIPFQNVGRFLEKLEQPDFKGKVIKEIGEENLEPLTFCLKYCYSNELDLLESSDLCIPFSGEFYTLSSNMRAIHLKNISDFSNQTRKVIPENFSNSIAPRNIDLDWWNELSDYWKERIKSFYQAMVRPIFKANHSARNEHVDTKFHKNTLDLSGLENFEEMSIEILSRKNVFSSMTLLFDFPKLRSIGIASSIGTEFDLKRILQFPNVEKLALGGVQIVNLSVLNDLKELRYLAIRETGLKPADLKKLNNFSRIKSLSLFFAPYRSVSFLKGNEHLESLALSYTRGLENLPNLKRLHMFPKEKKLTIKNCPNIELINCVSSRRMVDLSSFRHLSKLETLIIRTPHKTIDLSLLNEITSIKNFFVDNYTKLDSISQPIAFIENIYMLDNLDEKIKELARVKFPNAVFKSFIHIPYE